MPVTAPTRVAARRDCGWIWAEFSLAAAEGREARWIVPRDVSKSEIIRVKLESADPGSAHAVRPRMKS